MTPRAADPGLQDAVVTAAARILATEGRRALTTRRLASEVGASTMAIYSRFGSLDQVHQAVRRHGFTAITRDIDTIDHTNDPVCDLAAINLAYYTNGISTPELYRAMFAELPPGQDDAGTGVFDRIVGAVRRCIEAGRFDASEPNFLSGWAAEVWVANHGMVTLALTGLQPPGRIRFLLTDMTYRLAVGFGDRRDAAERSTRAAASRMLEPQ